MTTEPMSAAEIESCRRRCSPYPQLEENRLIANIDALTAERDRLLGLNEIANTEREGLRWQIRDHLTDYPHPHRGLAGRAAAAARAGVAKTEPLAPTRMVGAENNVAVVKQWMLLFARALGSGFTYECRLCGAPAEEDHRSECEFKVFLVSLGQATDELRQLIESFEVTGAEPSLSSAQIVAALDTTMVTWKREDGEDIGGEYSFVLDGGFDPKDDADGATQPITYLRETWSLIASEPTTVEPSAQDRAPELRPWPDTTGEGPTS